jgi:hypothetical protein
MPSAPPLPQHVRSYRIDGLYISRASGQGIAKQRQVVLRVIHRIRHLQGRRPGERSLNVDLLKIRCIRHTPQRCLQNFKRIQRRHPSTPRRQIDP